MFSELFSSSVCLCVYSRKNRKVRSHCLFIWSTYIVSFFFLVAVARINSITLEFTFMSRKWPNVQNTRGMELSLRSFASMRAVRLFCEHWHWVKKFVLRAACTSENTAWQAVCTPAYFFPSHLSFTKRKRCFESSDLADNSRTDIDNMVQPITSAYSQLWLVWCSFTWVRDGRSIVQGDLNSILTTPQEETSSHQTPESEHASTHLIFCEQFQQRPNFASTFKLNETIVYTPNTTGMPGHIVISRSPDFTDFFL